MFWGLSPGYTQENSMMTAVDVAAKQWDAIPMNAVYAFNVCAYRAITGQCTRWARRALAMHLGAAAARGDNVGAANIKAMIIACS